MKVKKYYHIDECSEFRYKHMNSRTFIGLKGSRVYYRMLYCRWESTDDDISLRLAKYLLIPEKGVDYEKVSRVEGNPC